MAYYVGTTRASGNKKIGPIPATWSTKATCPPSCPFLIPLPGKIAPPCYWWSGYRTNGIGKRLEEQPEKYGMDEDQFIGWILSLPLGQLWRDRVGGDQLPDLDLDPTGETLDRAQLQQVTRANKRRKARGFGYCHYDVLDNLPNRAAIQEAQAGGFVLNASGNSLAHAARIKRAAPLLSVTATAPAAYHTKDQTIDGQRFIQCPQTWNKKLTCQQCQLCAIPRRDYIIVFPAHGTGKRGADLIAMAA
jgi:hypothetical protein